MNPGIAVVLRVLVVKSDAINGNNAYYDLNGNRLDAPKKGLNIINGKKVIVK